jgi:aspartate-semialdehyde dehydrogenase
LAVPDRHIRTSRVAVATAQAVSGGGRPRAPQ